MSFGYGLGIGVRSYAIRASGGIPPDPSGAIGDVYLDTETQIWYEKRWVANREGAGDSILFPINLFPSVGDFDFSVRVRRDQPIDNFFLFGATSPDPSSAFHFRIDTSETRHSVLLRSSAGVVQHTLTSSVGTDTQWHTLGARRVGSALIISVDGVDSGTIANTSSWTPSTTQTGTFALRALALSAMSIKCCDLRLTGPGGSIIAPLNDGTGTTITNQAGANGTLTDGSPTNFWYGAWVPIINPSADFRIPTNSQYLGAML